MPIKTPTVLRDFLETQGYSSTHASITATGEDQATINLASVAGLSEVLVVYVVEIDADGSSGTTRISAEVHDPGHEILDTFTFQKATLSDERTTFASIIIARDDDPVAGDYHLDVTTLTRTSNTVSVITVINRWLIGIQS